MSVICLPGEKCRRHILGRIWPIPLWGWASEPRQQASRPQTWLSHLPNVHASTHHCVLGLISPRKKKNAEKLKKITSELTPNLAFSHHQSVTSQSRDFCQFFSSLGISIRKFGLEKKVSVSVSENLVSEKKSWYRHWKIWSLKKSISISISIKKFGIGKKVFVLVSANLVSKKKLQRKGGQKFLEVVCRGP